MLDRSAFDSIPEEPGVYVFRDSSGKVLYVGKAISLRRRVLQHFSGAPIDSREQNMRDSTASVEVLKMHNEVEALILENNLIKQYKPELNVLLKDDKTYPYIKITKEMFPRVTFTRKLVQDGGSYFGPYTDATAARLTIKHLRMVFPIRSCTLPLDGKRTYKPCLDYQIGLCCAPCALKVGDKEYSSYVQGFSGVLKGSYKRVLSDLYERMRVASDGTRYEEAANLRDRIVALERLATKQYAQLPGWADYDVVDAVGESAAVLHFRRGALIGRETLKLRSPAGVSQRDLVMEFIQLFYSSGRTPADTVLVRAEYSSLSHELDSWLKTKNSDAHLRGPRTRLESTLLDMCSSSLPESSSKQALELIGEIAGCAKTPSVIAGFDISNLGPRQSYGSAVCFVDGEPRRSEYRVYKSRSPGQNDFAKIRETVFRHVKRALAGDVCKPDVILIDGGHVQLNYALQGLRLAHAAGIPAISLAKKEETICLPDGREITLNRASPALKLLQMVRDEAHRFAIAHHRRARSKVSLRSALDSVPGVGPVRITALTTRYPTVEAIRNAKAEDLAKIPGISYKTAKKILSAL